MVFSVFSVKPKLIFYGCKFQNFTDVTFLSINLFLGEDSWFLEQKLTYSPKISIRQLVMSNQTKKV